MPELPEVETVRRTLKNMILGKTIEAIDIHYSKIIKDVSVTEFREKLIGRTLKDIDRYGKYLIFIFDDIALISHLRMEGKYFIKDKLDPLVKHEHIVFHFTDGSTFRYHDVRKFGTMDLRPLDKIYTSYPISKLGYEPYDTLMTLEYLKEKLKNKNRAIKTCLLDQTVMTGLGNIYVDEVLFLSNLHPERSASSLNDEDYINIIKNATNVLHKAIDLGGTTIRSYTSSLGVTGRFQNELKVHMKKGEPCPRCSTIIEKKKVNGRGSYYCPKCQTNNKEIN